MIQIAQKLFQKPEAADAALQTLFAALRTTIIALLQSARDSVDFNFYHSRHLRYTAYSLCIQIHQNQSWNLEQCNKQ